MTHKILRKYSEGVDAKTALEISEGKMATNKEADEAIQNSYDEIKDALPCWTSTHIRYKAGATEAEIWNEGEEPEKIFLPLNDGWYVPDEKYGIPNGEKSSHSDPKARHLWRWQNEDYDGLLSRYYYGWIGGDRRGVYACGTPGVRLGVVIRQNEKKSVAGEKIDWKFKYDKLLAKVREVAEDEEK